ncbi:hypothetical protein [Halobacterium litoreum]|uniref:Tat (Twin-arginine translocation) pathway signal sequence n=1 Tax=Halobacterium litoreum TaxID=2039234 RepID=A0ABD5NFC9_9EURY|nr:hypothetical protein [Halobacterium litoreum]UHH13340.1 hypothetical protein LT972_14425 [Halobacterium litoreum]
MASRRRFLRAGGVALAAAIAGCSGGGEGPETVETSTDEPTTDETTSTRPTRRLDATPVDGADVPDGATVAVAEPDLHQLVADAASAEGRADLARTGDGPGSDATLALGTFDYVRFRGETYDPSTSFAGFAQEAGYQYDLVEANESEVEGEPLRYADLTESERDIADAMLNDSYSVGHHEEKPAAAETFEPQDHLRVENATYRVRVTVGDHAAHHMLTLDAVSVGEGARVVTVLDRAPESEWTDELRAAVETGNTGLDGVEDADALADYLDGADYVVTATGVAEMQVVRVVE